MDQVFTWYGATIEMDGMTETDYTADEVLSIVEHISCMCIHISSCSAVIYNCFFVSALDTHGQLCQCACCARC